MSEVIKSPEMRVIPSLSEYKEKLGALATYEPPTTFKYRRIRLNDAKRCYFVLRLMAECGLRPFELYERKILDVDRFHKRGLYVQAESRRNKGKDREIPINLSLYQPLKLYIEGNNHQEFLFGRVIKSKLRGEKNLTYRSLGKMFNRNNIPWNPYALRHFFRAQIRYWMIQNKSVDTQVIKEMMGHTLTVAEKYGGDSPWEYKLEVVDKVFG